MNRKIKQLFTGLVFACLLTVNVCSIQLTALASSAQISFSDLSVMVGKEVMVTMKITSADPLGSSSVMVNYDTSMLEFVSGTGASGDAGAIRLTAAADSTGQKVFSFSLKFKALKAGTAKITVADQEVYNADSQLVSMDKIGDSTIKITPAATASKDAQLKSLKIDPGVLKPDFSPDITSYTAAVGADVTRLTVSAAVANAGANVQIEGGQDLQQGVNQVVCRVTAEDGQTVKEYTISVTRGAQEASEEVVQPGVVQVTVEDGQYQVAADFDDALADALPGEFTVTAYTYKGQQVKALRSAAGDLLLLYLTDAGGQGGFCVYDEAKDTLTKFAYVTAQTASVIVLPLAEDMTAPDGFTQWEITIDDVKVDGWVWSEDAKDKPDYCIFYGMNTVGEKGFYRYDVQERTVQRFFQDGVSKQKYMELGHTYNSLLHDYDVRFIIILALSCICLALFAALVLLYLKKKKMEERGGFYGYNRDLEPDPYERRRDVRSDRPAVHRKEPDESDLEDDYYIEDEEEESEEMAVSVESVPESKRHGEGGRKSVHSDENGAAGEDTLTDGQPDGEETPFGRDASEEEMSDGAEAEDDFEEAETLEELERKLAVESADEKKTDSGEAEDDFEIVELNCDS